jgi:hypothetical protein
MYRRALAVTTIALASQYGMALEAPTGLVHKNNVFSCMACSAAMDAVDAVIDMKLF